MGWQRNSLLAVDAGVHLSAIVKILDQYPAHTASLENPEKGEILTEGPFQGLQVPHSSARANAGHITHSLISTFLITHPHLDHIAGFVVNTAGLPGPNSRPKTLAGLPSTIEAFKTHIFNNIIWPNLSDENLGAGLVTYMRLVEGGSPAMGDGDSIGYIEISDGLSVKAWAICHGHCVEKSAVDSRRDSLASLTPNLQPESSPRRIPRSNSHQLLQSPRHTSIAPHAPVEVSQQYELVKNEENVYESTVYFIRDIATGKEILIFGDVEPDSISGHYRNRHVWKEAAPLILANRLQGIFIECSYDDSQHQDRLYGHMAPQYLIAELTALAAEVVAFKNNILKETKERKRKRFSDGLGATRRSTRKSNSQESAVSPLSQPPARPGSYDMGEQHHVDGEEEMRLDEEAVAIRPKEPFPLKGLKVVVIHVKDKLVDGPEMGEMVMKQLLEHEKEARLGVEFVLSSQGQAVFL